MNSISKQICVAGCPVDSYTMEGAIAELCRRIDSRTRTHVIFVNAAKAVQYHRDSALRAIMESADLLLADGMAIVWLSRLKRVPLPGRVAGVDLMEQMVAVAAERGYRVFFLGSRPEVVSKTVAILERKYPALRVAGYRDGYFEPSDEEQINAAINDSKADLLFIGMSTPRKELWADRNHGRLNVTVCQGVGGGFDVIAGVTQRAPQWMQRAGLEWFYRLCQEPGRMWKRYLFTNTSFIRLAICDLFGGFKKVHGLEVEAGSD